MDFRAPANFGSSISVIKSGSETLGDGFIKLGDTDAEWALRVRDYGTGGNNLTLDRYASGAWSKAVEFDRVNGNVAFSENITVNGAGLNVFKGPMWATYFGTQTPDGNLWYAYATNSEYAIAQNGVIKVLSFAPGTGNAEFAGDLKLSTQGTNLIFTNGGQTIGFDGSTFNMYAATGIKFQTYNYGTSSVVDALRISYNTGNATFSGSGEFAGDVTAQNFHGSIGSEHIIDVNSEQDQIGHFVAMQSDCSYGASAYGPSSFAAAAHTHTIVNVTGLQTVLNGKTSNNGPNGATVIIGSDGHSYYWDGAAIQGLE